MLIIDSPHLEKGIQKVEFKGVRPVQPASFRVDLCLPKLPEPSGEYSATLLLTHGDHCENPTIIKLGGTLPGMCIPEFLVNSKVLLEVESVAHIVGLAVMKLEKISVVLSLEKDEFDELGGDQIVALFSIDSAATGRTNFKREGFVLANDASRHLVKSK